MSMMSFNAVILQNENMDAAYVEVPYDIKQMYGKGRLLVDATFDGVPYQGLIVKMGSPVFIIGITKSIRKKIGKTFGDTVTVTFQERVNEKLLWKCPKCGREFKNQGQSHFCGEKPKTIKEYIAGQDPEKQADLLLVYETLRNALAGTEERISWSMPTFWQKHNILHFAASKKHIGLYPGPAAVVQFADDLQDYNTDKGTIRIPYGHVDTKLIERIARWCLETGNHA